MEEWPGTVDSVEKRFYSWVFKLREKPFVSPVYAGNAYIESVAKTRQFFCRLTERMENSGYRLATTAYTGKNSCRTTMFFLRGRPVSPMADIVDDSIFCVAIRGRDTIQFPRMPALARCGIEWVHEEFSSQVESEEDTPESMEVTLRGSPFTAAKLEEKITSKRFFLSLIRQSYMKGYAFAAPLSIRGQGKNDTFIFRKIKGQKEKSKNFFLMSLENRSRIRLFECPPDVTRAIEECYPSGRIKETKPSYLGCTEVGLNGSPFYTDQSNLLETQLEILEIVQRLRQLRWRLSGSLQASTSYHDKATLLFESVQEEKPPENIFGIATVRSDTLRLLKVPRQVRTMIREMIISSWEKGVQEEYDMFQGYQIKLRGNPWSKRDTSMECNQALQMMVFVIEKLSDLGWRFMCSMDVGSRINDEDDSRQYCLDGELMVFESVCPASFTNGTAEA
ncbi:hypothetical protein AAVH_01976 [Aphelenchoides avenae]|nr:hypothetical protein AAVH_01976 [Aphelenchus avenae]